jgi:hypothetical protein
MNHKLTLLIVSVCLASHPDAFGDMGSIPLKAGVQVFEPNQDAIIVWNGTEQLLYLRTTLRTSAETKVIEVMPLPNRPVVESIDSGVFKRMSFFLPVQEPASGTIDPFGGETKPEPRPAGEIVERKEIGAHALTTVRVEDSAGFSQWVKDEFGAEGKIEIPDPLLKVIQLYLDDGYDWFIFDTVDLSTAFSEKETLKIRFQSDHLYYPMRITRLESGETEVNLAIVTDVLFEDGDMAGINRTELEVTGRPRKFVPNRLAGVDPTIPTLFKPSAELKVRNWKIKGKLSEFSKDLLVRHPDRRNAPQN